MNLEEVKAANRERNTEIVQAAREGYADGNECTSIAAALFKVAEQFRARGVDITQRKVKGHVSTTKALTFAAEEVENVAASLTAEGSNWVRAASEVAGVAVSLERDGVRGVAEQCVSSYRGHSGAVFSCTRPHGHPGVHAHESDQGGYQWPASLDDKLDAAFSEPPLPARSEAEMCAAGFELPNGAVAACYYRAGHEGMHSDGHAEWPTVEDAAADALIAAGAHAERCTARLDDSGPDGGEGVRCTLPAGHEGGHADSDEGLRPEWYSEPPLTDAELPGMWESADFTGGETDAKRWPTDAEITENHRQLTQQDNPDVCGSTSAGEPCALPTGHTGTHIGTRGGRWPQAHALTPHVEGEPVPEGAIKVTVGGSGIPGVDGAAFIAEGEAARMLAGPVGDFSIGTHSVGNRYTAQESGWHVVSAPAQLQRVGSTTVLELNDARPVELSLGVDSMFPGTEPHVVEQRVYMSSGGALATLPLAASTLVIGGPARTAPASLEAPGEPKGYQSASSIETMLDCPMKYRLKYRDRLTESPSWWFEGGKAFHSWVEQTERRLAFSQPHVVEMACDVIAGEAPRDLAEIFEQQITKTADEKGVAPEKWRAAKKGAEGREFWEGLLPDMAARYLLERQATAKDYGIAITPYGLPMLEHEIRLDVAGVPIVGYIDQVRRNLHTGALVIRDLKAGARKPETDFQVGGLYRQALLSLYPDMGPQDVRGEYFMTRKAEVVPAANWTRTAVEHQVASVDAMDRAGIFPAHPSSFCSSCPFRRQCPVMGGEE